MIPERGTVLDSYKLLARVGAGSCGVVWQAENVISGEIEALKILSCNALAERELRALRLYREFEHKNLIRIRHVGKFEDTLFYTMDWCETSLAEKRVRPDELLEIAKQLLSALALLHAKGFLHRDIKPANVFFRQGVPVLGDVGLLTTENGATIAGSPGFLSPALLSGKGSADRYSDVYALAKSLYCALSGFSPERFPSYKGELTEAASLLMRGIILVCGDGSIDTAEKFLDFLNSAQMPETHNKARFILLSTVSLVLLSSAVLGAYAIYDAIAGKKAETMDEAKTSDEKKTEQKAIETDEKAVPVVTGERIVFTPQAKHEVAAHPPVTEKTEEVKPVVPQPAVEVKRETKDVSSPVRVIEREAKKEAAKTANQSGFGFFSPASEVDLDKIPPEEYTNDQRLQRKIDATRMLIMSLEEISKSSSDDEAAEYGLTNEQLKAYKKCKDAVLSRQKGYEWNRARITLQMKLGFYYDVIQKASREKKDPVRELQKAVKNDKIYALAVSSNNVYASHEALIRAINNGEDNAIVAKHLEDFRRCTDEQGADFSCLRPSDYGQ